MNTSRQVLLAVALAQAATTATASTTSAAMGSTEPTIATSLYYGFSHPQDTARTKVWWFHGETAGTHAGITADLEAFRQQGVGGVVYYDQVHGNGDGAFQVFTPEWWDELVYSSQEARRLGLSFECNVSNGYVAGGRWIAPDKSMQRLGCTELLVDGGRDVCVQLPMASRLPGQWHRDVAVVAVPYAESTLGDSRQVLSTDSVVKLPDPSQPFTIDLDFGHEFTARSITYTTAGRGKARTSSMQVPPFSPRVGKMEVGTTTTWDFYGCGFRLLPPIGELQVSTDGKSYTTVCQLRPKYKNFGGVKEQTVAFPATKGRYFRVRLHDWGTGHASDSTLTFGNMVLSARAQVDAWQEKASLISEFVGSDLTPDYSADELADFARAVDLTQMVAADGTLTWRQAPRGRWLVVRLFAMSTGGRTKHGRSDALGLECDKLSAEGARQQWQSYVKPIIDTLRAHGGQLTGICMDSHEAGPQNWTIDMEQQFHRLRGYDLRRWLPVLAGFVVGSAQASDRVLYDLRRTINDLVADRYYGEFNRLCHAEGLVLTAQAIGGALCMAGDAVAVKRLVDKPQGEFWGYQTEGSYDIKDCSSAAHLYGKPIASGEAFTDITYQESPEKIKNLFDYALAFGINEFVVCAVAYQPWVSEEARVKHGGQCPHPTLKLNTANGRQYALNRLNTYWPHSRPFWDYQARCSWLMRQGKPVNDLCYLLGDDLPVRLLGHHAAEMPVGYGYDVFTTDALFHRMAVSEGRIVLPDGISYQAMVLPFTGSLKAETLSRIEELRSQGATIIDPQHDLRPLATILAEKGIGPDVALATRDTLYFCHRQTADNDIYFLNNHSDHDIDDNLHLRTEATTAERWNPVSGERVPLPMACASGTTTISLRLAAHESCFIVMGRQKGLGQTAVSPYTEQQVSMATANWQVSFDPAKGGPQEPVVFEHLGDWTQHANPLVSYFSGTATATTTFRIDKKDEHADYTLHLPLLNTTAEVIVNGMSAGIVWCSPYTVNVSRFLRQGDNTLELRLCNSLWNRLVGDAQPDCHHPVYWQTHPIAKPTDKLVPSGLAGPPSLTKKELR